MAKGSLQIEYEKLVLDNTELQERIQELKIENAKLNLILYHRENGLSHPDFNAEIEISKQAERIKELELDIENRRTYETYLQSSEHPVYSYAVWLNQQALKPRT